MKDELSLGLKAIGPWAEQGKKGTGAGINSPYPAGQAWQALCPPPHQLLVPAMPQPLLGAWPSSQILTVGSPSAELRSLVLCVGATSGCLEPAEWGQQAVSLGHPLFLAWKPKCAGVCVCVGGNNRRHSPFVTCYKQINQPSVVRRREWGAGKTQAGRGYFCLGAHGSLYR